MGVMGK